MCGQQNVRASTEDNTGQNTDKGHTPNPRSEIKIPNPAGNRTRAAGRAGLKGRDSTDHATATDRLIYNRINLRFRKFFSSRKGSAMKKVWEVLFK